jgi:hypothetical protein
MMLLTTTMMSSPIVWEKEDDEVDSDDEANGDIVERQVVLCLDIRLLKRILLTADIAVLQSLDRPYSHGSGYAVLDKAAGKVDPRLLPWRLITKLIIDRTKVGDDRRQERAKLIDTFLTEYGDFINKRGSFARDHTWITATEEDLKAY